MNDSIETSTEQLKKYTSRILYISYILMLVASIIILLISLYFEEYTEMVIAIPVIFILIDALTMDRSTINIPPLMIFMLVLLMVALLIGRWFEYTSAVLSIIIDLMFGVILGLTGLITTYSLLKTMPGVRDEKPFMISFVSMSIALALFAILTMIVHYSNALSGNEPIGVDEVMNNMLIVIIGAGAISILFYLNKHIGLFKYTVTKYMEDSAETLGLEEYEKQEIEKALNSGENENTEYKSTLRTNLATGEKDPRMEKAVLKTLVAFLNSKGGTLIIGVNDSGEIIGIDENSFENRDKLNLHITNLIASQIGNEFLPYISFRLVDFEDKGVMRVKCLKSDSPVFLKEGKIETFYVRSGPSSVDLTGTNLIEYVNVRFKKRFKKTKRLDDML